MKPPIDRPLADIIKSMRWAIVNEHAKGQFARDLEKLCLEVEKTLTKEQKA